MRVQTPIDIPIGDDGNEEKERNRLILQAYQEGYSQHMIDKVLNLAQPEVNGIIKRGKKK
jgi:hypothetical protein